MHQTCMVRVNYRTHNVSARSSICHLPALATYTQYLCSLPREPSFPFFPHPERHLDAADEPVRGLARGRVQRLLDELPEPATVLDLVDLAELVAHVLLGVEVPQVQAQ